MTDHGNSDSAGLQVLLERTDPPRNVARYYVLSVEATLFARNTLVRRWGRIGSTGRQRLEFFASRDSAGLALETWLAKKRKRGYMLIVGRNSPPDSAVTDKFNSDQMLVRTTASPPISKRLVPISAPAETQFPAAARL